MKRYFNKKNVSCFLMLITGLTGMITISCENKLDIDSANVASETKQWTDISDTRSSLMGLYGLTRAALQDNNAHWVYGEMRGKDFVSYKRSDLEAVYKNDLKASYPMISALSNWRRFYAVVNAASIFIERAPEVYEKDERYTELNLKYDIAQARAIRAFAYFYMVRIWGDVPLLTKSYDDGKFTEFGRTDQASVLAFASQELLKAAEDLPYLYGVNLQTYYGVTSVEWRGVLFNKLTAYALLAHIAAWQGKYIDADVFSKFVLDNYSKVGLFYSNISQLTGRTGIFSSSEKYSQLLNFQSSYAFNEATATGHIEQLTLAKPLTNKTMPDIFVPKDSVITIFNDPNDTRFGIDTISGLTRTNYFTNFSGEIPIFSKIKVIRDGDGDSDFNIFGSNLVFTRLEEITLLRAEAKAALGEISEARTLLNVIRTSRGLPAFHEGRTENIVDVIFEERRRELMGEGWRWYDIIRFNKLRKKDSNVVKLINDGGIYWPIATDVLRNNSQLVQNPYWK
ncbi:RagB/SusD family nutrient uptake outer membrane protein [Sphingobacterium spiritivorum]|nr:RagB/SusD family nutrient uptake outer membrane protein [Sphingobacterium spiritivorum]